MEFSIKLAGLVLDDPIQIVSKPIKVVVVVILIVVVVFVEKNLGSKFFWQKQ